MSPKSVNKSRRRVRRLTNMKGPDYFAVVRAIRTQCHITAIARLPRLGKKAPRCFEQLGRTLALLDQIASCLGMSWNGRGTCAASIGRARSQQRHCSPRTGAHRSVRRITGNVEICRGVGESALALLRRYNVHGYMARSRTKGSMVGIPTARGSPQVEASSKAVVGGRGRVQSSVRTRRSRYPGHSPECASLGAGGRPTLGGFYREESLVACLNEIGWAVGVLALPAVKVVGGRGAWQGCPTGHRSGLAATPASRRSPGYSHGRLSTSCAATEGVAG
jgi:hypothetical protein